MRRAFVDVDSLEETVEAMALCGGDGAPLRRDVSSGWRPYGTASCR